VILVPINQFYHYNLSAPSKITDNFCAYLLYNYDFIGTNRWECGSLAGASQPSIEYKTVESFQIIFSKNWKWGRKIYPKFMCVEM